MEISEIKGPSSFETWLQNKPREWAQVLAVRAALRVAPLAWAAAALPNERSSKNHSDNLILSIFRACFISSVECKYPADDMSSVVEAVNSYSASYNAETIPIASYAINSAIAARAAFYAPSYAADAVANTARAADDWQNVREDCAWLEFSNNRYLDDDIPTYALGNKHKTLAAELSRHSLWFKGFDERGKSKAADMPKRILAAFNQFSNSELAQTTSFGFIAEWYNDLNSYISRADPKNILTKEAEIAIAKMSNHDWGDGDDERDCVAVMDRVAAIAGWMHSDDGVIGDGEEGDDPFRPETVNQGIGPTFSANDNNELDRLPALPNLEENQNPALCKIFDRLKKRLNLLKAALGNNLSRYSQLAEILDDYEEALNCSDITEIDIDELWMSGVGLISQARAFAALDPSKQVTEPMEPQAQGILGELARLHGGLIMGFSKGRELAEQSGIPLLSNPEFIALLEYEKTIVRWLLESDQYALSDKSRELFRQLDNIFYSTNESADVVAKIGYPVLRNLIIHTANTLEYAEKKAGQLSLVGVPVNLFVTGVLAMLQNNLSPILAFANSVPELRAYLEYHLHRLEIEFEESDKENEDNST